MFRSARGASFDDRLQFHSGVAQNTVGHFGLTAHPISCGHPRVPQAHRKYQIEGRPLHVWTFSLPISHRTDDAHDMLLLCPLIRRVSHWTKPPYSSRNFVQFLCQPVPALDDQVRTLQQDLRTQPSLQRRRFSCVALCAHRGFLGSTRGGSVGWCCAAMPARNRSSHCNNVEASLGPQIEHDGFDRLNTSCGNRTRFFQLRPTYSFLSVLSRAFVAVGNGVLVVLIAHRTDGLAIHGRWVFVEEVSFSSAADAALVGSWRLPSGS